MGITDPSQEYFKDGGWGWNGSKWVKLPLLFGYHDQYVEDLGEVKTGGGTFVGDSTPVPAGEIWVIQLAVMHNATGTRAVGRIELMGGVNYAMVAFQAVSTANVPLLFTGPLVLAEGDYVKMRMWSCLDSDSIKASVWGYKMKVT